MESGVIPLLASPQGGVAERLKRFREASADRRAAQARQRAASREAGVVFRLRTKRKTTPSARNKVASRLLICRAATPPCGDARRGICSPVIHSHVLKPAFKLFRAALVALSKHWNLVYRLRVIAHSLRCREFLSVRT